MASAKMATRKLGQKFSFLNRLDPMGICRNYEEFVAPVPMERHLGLCRESLSLGPRL